MLYSIDLAEAKTNNQAEYGALLCALDLVDILRITAQSRPVELTFHTDSALLVGQVWGQFKVKNQRLAELRQAALAGLDLLRKAGVQVKYVRVPREVIVEKLGH
jgi:ribonuclease HI